MELWQYRLAVYQAEQGARLDAALYHPALATALYGTLFTARNVAGQEYAERLGTVTPEAVRTAVRRAVAALQGEGV